MSPHPETTPGDGATSEHATQAAILDALPATIALIDSSGIIVSVNESWRQFARANGLTDRDLGVGRSYLEICDRAAGPGAEESRGIAAGLRSVLAGSKSHFSIEYACHSPAEQRWFLMTVTPLHGDRTSGAVVMHLDVTVRRLAEAAIERTLERLSEVRRIGRIGDWDFDIVAQTFTWSPEMFEMTEGGPLHRSPLGHEANVARFDAASRAMHADGIARAISTGESQQYELVVPRPGQATVFIHAEALPVKNERGDVIRVHGIVQDVSARKRADSITAHRERMLSTMLSSIKDFAYIFDREGRFLFANQPLLDLWGITLESAVGRNFLELGYPADLAAHLQQQVSAVIDTGRSITDETPYVSPRGVQGWYEYIFSPVVAASGAVEFVVGSTRDVTERKKAEDELRASDEKFQQLADHLTDAFWIRSADMSTVHYISPAFEQIWGRSVDQLYENPLDWPLFIVEEDREYAQRSFEAFTAGLAALDIEYRISRPNGDVRWIRARAFRMRNDAGVVVRNIGIATDVTEKRQVTEALRASEAEQRQLAEQLDLERARLLAAQRVAKVGSWEFDLATMEGLSSAETHRIFEMDPATSVTLELVFALVHPEDREAVAREFTLSHSRQGPFAIEHRVLLPDGRIKFIEERWHFVFDGATPVRAVGTCQDISERKLAEISIEQARQRLRDIFDGLGPSIFTGLLTPEGILVEINRPSLEAAALQAGDVVGKPFAETPWWTASPEVQQQLRDAIARAAGGQASRYDVRIRGAEGSFIDLDFSLQPLRDESGKVIFLIPSATVITERKLAEGALRQAQKMEAVGQLAAGVAHEFNNILQTLMSMATITRLRGESAETVKMAEEMEVQIRRGAGVTRQLLVASRNVEMVRTRVDLRAQIAMSRDLLRRLMPETIEILVKITDDEAFVEGDDGQIQQVLLNLAINARDAMPGGGRLTLRVATTATEACLEVEDNGHGFDEKTRERIFEPFFTTKDVGQGSGLGLAVVYGIVEQLGGRIEVSSRPGSGTLFRVIFRRTHEAPPAPATAPEVAVPERAGSILLFEDEEGVRAGLVSLLEALGYRVTAAGSAEEAFALPLSPDPDLILSDVSLPGISGPILARQLRKRWPLVRVVLMTGYITAETRQVSAEEGWSILQKPFEFDALNDILLDATPPQPSSRS